MVKRLKSSLPSLRQLSEGIKNGDISPTDLIEACLDRIKKFDPSLNAFISVIDEKTLYEQSQRAEKEVKQGHYRSPLHGIPFSIKDIFYANGIRCTMGSKIFSNYIPRVDATVVERLKRAGAILIGTKVFMGHLKTHGIFLGYQAVPVVALRLLLQRVWSQYLWEQIRGVLSEFLRLSVVWWV
jgi:Amidase